MNTQSEARVAQMMRDMGEGIYSAKNVQEALEIMTTTDAGELAQALWHHDDVSVVGMIRSLVMSHVYHQQLAVLAEALACEKCED